MSKRKWTNMQVLEPQILAMREAGLSRRMIADELGLELRQIENWINRQNRARAKLSLGIVSKRKGRPRKRPLSTTGEYEQEIARLQMENKLLRDFLQLTERK